MIMFFEIIIME